MSMTGDEIVTRVHNSVLDPDLNATETLKTVNRGLLDLCEHVLFTILQDEATVTATPSSSTVALPATFHRNLFLAYDDTNSRDVAVLFSIKQLQRRYPGDPTRTGRVSAVAHDNENLHYRRRPSVDVDLIISFYRKPTILTGSGTPDCFGPRAQEYGEEALYHYTCWKLWAMIEDGVEGQKVNTGYHKNEYMTIRRILEKRFNRHASYPKPVAMRGCFL